MAVWTDCGNTGPCGVCGVCVTKFLREPSADAYEITRSDCGDCPSATNCNVAARCLREAGLVPKKEAARG